MHDLYREHFQMNIESFQALSHMLSHLDKNVHLLPGSGTAPIEKRVAIRLRCLGTGESHRSTSVYVYKLHCT